MLNLLGEEIEEKEDVPVKDKKQSPFMLIMNALFMDKTYIFNLTKESARQNIFMVLRRIAIKYPVEANVFNDGKVNPLDVLKFFSDYLFVGTFVPKWIYTSGAKKSSSKKSDLTEDEINLYKKHYDITDETFEDAMRFFPEETISEIKDIVDFYKQVEKLKKEQNG